jgi:hypothetical protein
MCPKIYSLDFIKSQQSLQCSYLKYGPWGGGEIGGSRNEISHTNGGDFQERIVLKMTSGLSKSTWGNSIMKDTEKYKLH